MTRTTVLVAAILACSLAWSAADAAPSTAADYVALGARAFQARRYPDAVAAYRQAVGLERTPLNLCRVAIASAYLQPLSTSFGALGDWLEEKRQLAIAKGETEESWNQLTVALTAFRLGVKAEEDRIAALEQEVARLKLEVVDVRTEKTQVEMAADVDRAHYGELIKGLEQKVDRWEAWSARESHDGASSDDRHAAPPD